MGFGRFHHPRESLFIGMGELSSSRPMKKHFGGQGARVPGDLLLSKSSKSIIRINLLDGWDSSYG